ncbi:MAG TPA: ATP-binding protein [Paraburkholderia sp.]|jgi:signal transduction histidine kinase|nr:ATP-binding protein [Paraburkholderia sp.]
MKLLAKGLLLIAVPGAIELALLGAVFGTQQEAARAARNADASQQILWQASSLADPLMREAARVRTGLALGDSSFIDRHAVWIEFADRSAQLARAVADNPIQRARVDRMREAADAWRTRVADLADALRAGRGDEAALADGDALPPQLVVVRSELHQFVADERQLSERRSASWQRTRDRQQAVLSIAVIGSMLIWAAAAAVFSRNIGNRLAQLGDNARRFGERLPLAPPLPGNDEIAALDAVLHQTHDRLRDAAGQQAALKLQLEARAADLASANEHLRQETQDNEMFVYSVSHDLRSPLVNLRGFSKELQVSCDELRVNIDAAGLPEHERARMAKLLDGDVGESLTFLHQAVVRAAAIIDSLLRVSRAGRVEYRWQQVDVAALVARLIDNLRASHEARDVRIAVSALPPVWGDAHALEQAFACLIDNALHYLDSARPGHVEIGALDDGPPPAARGNDAPAGAVFATPTRTYFVRDNGVGIARAYLPKLFHAFQRLHGDDTRGHGIGLALARRIVERHGGRIWVESAEGDGSTFFVALPAVTPAGIA